MALTANKNIVIWGGGYTGLTSAVHYARAGWNVVIYDIDPKVVDGINSGYPRSGEFLDYLDADVKKLVESSKLFATNQLELVKDCKVHCINVPSEKDGEPYDDIVAKVLGTIVVHVDKPLIMIESTLTPGFVDSWIIKQNVVVGEDVFIAVCPRKDWFADKEKNLANLPRVVGGVTKACTDWAYEVISTVSKDIHLTDYRTAEVSKALENYIYHTCIMAVHELALDRPDLNIAEATRLAGLHWRIPQLHLGFGAGGRCVPLGSKYLAKAARDTLWLAEDNLEIDALIRVKVANHIYKISKQDNKKVLVMGVAYRPDFKDAGLSPGLAIARHLKDWGIVMFIDDPMFSDNELDQLSEHIPVCRDMSGFDIVLLATPHSVYVKHHNPVEELSTGAYILDANGAWEEHRKAFQDKGITYKVVGEPGWLTQ